MRLQLPATRRVHGATIFPERSSRTARSIPATDPFGSQGSKRRARRFPRNSSIRARQHWPRSGPRPMQTRRPLPAGFNYYQPIPNINNGWIYRLRLDYQLGDQIRRSTGPTSRHSIRNWRRAMVLICTGRRAMLSPTRAAASLRPSAANRWQVTSSTTSTPQRPTTSWRHGPSADFPFVQPNPSAAYRTRLATLTVRSFKPHLVNIPAYSSAGTASFPDFSQASIFDNPPGQVCRS